jgi:hypothetical protein
MPETEQQKRNYIHGELTGRAGVFAIINNTTFRTLPAAMPHLQRLKLKTHVVYALEQNEKGELCIAYIAVDKDYKPGQKYPTGASHSPMPTASPSTPPPKPEPPIAAPTGTTISPSVTPAATTTTEPGTGTTHIPETPLKIPGELTIGIKVNLQNFENIGVEFSAKVVSEEDVTRLKEQVADIVLGFGRDDLNTKRYVDHAVERIFGKNKRLNAEVARQSCEDNAKDHRGCFVPTEPDMSGVAYDTESTEPPI